eukprot:TRINITY_DN205_c0_g1_i1.p1 TRINITY_DN205_c0_g1~~TRINITY_DN205_c0_g1_i1.p1  ORF type:complete len:347 (-),score=67.10 TRINITY_DN205_c0_g1_i1:46-1086(-)
MSLSSIHDETNSITERYEIKLIGGSSNNKLAKDVAGYLNTTLEEVILGKFSDGESRIQIMDSIRGADVFVIQPTCGKPEEGYSVNDSLMELLLLIHTLKLCSCKRITAVIPYFGYARQDRKHRPRVPISASAVAQLIETMGPSRCVTFDLHADQIQGFFRYIPVDNIWLDTVFVSWILEQNFEPSKLAIVSPDAGAVERARRVADKVHSETNVVTIIKRRIEANKVHSIELIGDVLGKTCIIVDDMVDTAGTLCKAAGRLMDEGADRVVACISHGVLSGEALKKIAESQLTTLVVTDTIPQERNQKACPKLTVVPVGEMLAGIIKQIHTEKSISEYITTLTPDFKK